MLLSVIAYLSIILFVGISMYKAARFTNMPMHGRMDLYPVPKEEGFEHGGSFYEEIEWWKKPHKVSHVREVKEMLKEIIFIKKLFENQRPFWWVSYALHLGIYFIMAWTILLVIGAVAHITSASTGAISSIINILTILTGVIGIVIATIGSGFLFLRRLTSNTLKKYTTPQEYFNLLLIFAALITGILAWFGDLSFDTVREVTANLITFNTTGLQALNGIQVLNIILVAIMLAYIPTSKMSHYVGKYFTFHKVLWDNDPNLKGSEIERKIKDASTYKPTNKWSASHINPPTAGK